MRNDVQRHEPARYAPQHDRPQRQRLKAWEMNVLMAFLGGGTGGGNYGLFALYAAGRVALGIAATALGFWLAK